MLAYFPGIMMPQFLVLASICSFAGEQLLRVQSLINPVIATTRLLLLWESLCIIWSDEETWICAGADEGSRISIIMNFPLLCYAHLLNLAFRVWIYSARISEVWKHNVDKNLICLSSCLLVNMVVLEYKMKEMENRNKWYVNQELWRYRKRTRTRTS